MKLGIQKKHDRKLSGFFPKWKINLLYLNHKRRANSPGVRLAKRLFPEQTASWI
jgi:hypothetical protein